jgi:hypothetical protein
VTCSARGAQSRVWWVRASVVPFHATPDAGCARPGLGRWSIQRRERAHDQLTARHYSLRSISALYVSRAEQKLIIFVGFCVIFCTTFYEFSFNKGRQQFL